MTRNLTDYRLGDICRLVKGSYSSTKTPPGSYPLVVTAAQRRTALTHDLRGPAVCIPLISSTGHGDAAIHRLHFQEGPFALANLLVALLPHQEGPADAEYLYWYLTTKKDDVLVPLMRGTANVSLKEKDVANVVVSLPPLPEQRRIVARIKSMLDKVEEARSLAQAVKEQQVELLQALAYRADLTTDQKLAQGWTHVRLSEILQPGALREVVVADKSYPNFGIYSFGKGPFRKPDISGMDTSAQSLYRAKAGQFIYSRLFAFEGSYGLVPDDLDGFYVSNEYPAFDVDRSRATPEFVKAYFLRPGLWPQLAAGSKGLGDRRQRIQPDQILNHELLLPPIEVQERLTAVSRLIDTARAESNPSQEQLAALPTSILVRAFAGEL